MSYENKPSTRISGVRYHEWLVMTWCAVQHSTHTLGTRDTLARVARLARLTRLTRHEGAVAASLLS